MGKATNKYKTIMDIIYDPIGFVGSRLPNYEEASTISRGQALFIFFLGDFVKGLKSIPSKMVIRDSVKFPATVENYYKNNTIAHTGVQYGIGSVLAGGTKVSLKSVAIASSVLYGLDDKKIESIAESVNYPADTLSRFLSIAEKDKQRMEKENSGAAVETIKDKVISDIEDKEQDYFVRIREVIEGAINSIPKNSEDIYTLGIESKNYIIGSIDNVGGVLNRILSDAKDFYSYASHNVNYSWGIEALFETSSKLYIMGRVMQGQKYLYKLCPSLDYSTAIKNVVCLASNMVSPYKVVTSDSIYSTASKTYNTPSTYKYSTASKILFVAAKGLVDFSAIYGIEMINAYLFGTIARSAQDFVGVVTRDSTTFIGDKINSFYSAIDDFKSSIVDDAISYSYESYFFIGEVTSEECMQKEFINEEDLLGISDYSSITIDEL